MAALIQRRGLERRLAPKHAIADMDYMDAGSTFLECLVGSGCCSPTKPLMHIDAGS